MKKNIKITTENIKVKREKISSLEFFISKKIGRAIFDYNMLSDNDRILVAVSGGKDSLTLLRILHQRQSFVPIKYKLLAVHIVSDFHCQGCANSKNLEKFFKENDIDYIIKKIEILKNSKKKIDCFWCSWNRRKALFDLAKEHSCKKIAFGHHKDDIAQTMLLNLFFNGEISTMPAKLSMFNGEFHIIRPLAYVEEKDIARFAKEINLPINACRCPYGADSSRNLMRNIIKEVEEINPKAKTNIIKSLERIKEGYLL